ncbi:sensor histidine kinase [Amycolatopsis suaedae]|uniref:histidine kinase n=1 Tax=Amycolatopsis suaedae TaxID=2510978 RepID=A0A4Q7J5L2_9PSEU|nr:sensor histidine kinase [Amycolatopsis suaedae]RZQ62148.1 sensor histidine kinase [Amycolatopsis suaedae]
MVPEKRTQRVPSAGDVALAVIVAGFVAGTTTSASHWRGRWPGAPGEFVEPTGRMLDLLGYCWLFAATLPLLLARRFPLPVFAVTAVLAIAYYHSNYPGGPVIVAPAVALFTLTRLRGLVPGAVAGGALLLGLYVTYVAANGQWLPGAGAAGLVGGVVAVIGIGLAVRDRMAANRARRDQAAEHAVRMAEQERLRIAREVHDVVAHSLAMINVQAGVAAHVADRRPEQAKEALHNIKEASASALTDLRATLAVLRGGQETGPSPSLQQMSELIDHASAAGLNVRVHGEPGQLPAPTDQAAYRILQESLTNVVRHANQPRNVDVRLRRSGNVFQLVVRDDGQGATPPKTGNGLRGMRERAEALGGWVRASVVDGGFEVRAELPVSGEGAT